jgi:hypothetical protein
MRIKLQDEMEYQRWFAWHPVMADGLLVWLEIVERKWIGDWNMLYEPKGWVYHLIDEEDENIPL